MRKLFVLLLAIGFGEAHAQHTLYYELDSLLGGDTNFLIEAANGDVVQVCQLVELGLDTVYVVFRRFTADGTLVTAKRVSPLTGLSLRIYAGVELPDGSFLLVGSLSPHPAVIHLDAMGALLSVRRSDDVMGGYRSLVRVNDNTFIAGASHTWFADRRMVLSRFDATGSYQGSTSIQLDGEGALPVAAVRSVNGGAILCGKGTENNDTLSTNAAYTWLVRLNEQGNTQWVRRYRDHHRLFSPSGLTEDQDGNITVGGYIRQVASYSHCYMMQVDAWGDTLAVLEYSDALDPMISLGIPTFMAPDDDSFLFTGPRNNGQSQFLLGVSSNGTPQDALMTTEVSYFHTPLASTSGTVLVAAATSTPLNGTAIGYWRTQDPFSFSCSDPMDVAVADISVKIDTVFEEQGMVLVFDNVTNLFTTFASSPAPFELCLSAEIGTSLAASSAIRIHPVPSADRVTLFAPAAERYTIYDAHGRSVVLGSFLDGPSTEVDIALLPAGLYMVRITTRAGTYTGKLIKE